MSDRNRSGRDVPRVANGPDSLYVEWPGGHRSRHLYFWLRENCHCPRCTHPDAWERTADFLAIPLDIAPASVRADGHGLHVEWPEHDAPCAGSFFSWDWLDAHRAERGARLERKVRRRGWTASDFGNGLPRFPHREVMGSDAALLAFLGTVDATGVALVEGLPDAQGAVTGLAERVGFIEESHFGRHFDVVSRANAENLAYTAGRLQPHSDLPSRRHPPGIQFLHCLRNDATGGDSVLADSIACAEALRERDPAAFELLSTHSVTFTSTADGWDIANRAPVIDVDEDGDIVGSRLHPALLGPVDVEPESQMAFYRAFRGLLSIASSEAMQLRVRLRPGECQVFDNRRVLHGRDAFDPATGDRFLQGCYVGRDEFESRLKLLRRGGRDFRET
ncbi:MAG: DUF971 domain-containing protein [Gammaproteobacteria bacterium]|nr:DUF971 domain-containing protein [Gammaproteobacteria bacterium]